MPDSQTGHMQKTILVTGCSEGGAGAALAAEFARRGHKVFGTIRGDTSKAQYLAGRGVTPIEMDVTSQPSIQAAVAKVHSATGGKLDVLINNAAVFSLMPLADVKLEAARHLFEANVFGVLMVTQAFLPLLTESQAGAVVANISSISAFMCPPWQGIYSASKAALTALGHTMRLEFQPLGVRVMTIVSGGVETPLKRQAGSVPAGSVYQGLASSIESNELSKQYKPMPPSEYARQVADEILKQDPKPMIWKGSFATFVWILQWLGWVGMLDGGQLKRSGLSTIASSPPLTTSGAP